MKVVGYARVSKPKKRKDGSLVPDGLSIEHQRTAIARAAEYNGWDLVDVLVDNGKTGANTRRDGLQDALGLVRSKQADMLVVVRHDRLSRDAVDFGTLLKEADKKGWFISVLDQKIDTSTPYGWYMAWQMALSAELERRLIAARTKDALAVLKDNGVELGQRSPISAEVKRKVMRLHRAGHSASAIARRLTADGDPTPSGKPWHHSVVARLIKREQQATTTRSAS